MLQGTDRNSTIQNLRAANKAVPSLPLIILNYTLKKEAACDSVILISNYQTCGPGSSVGIATDYGWTVRGSNPGGDEIFLPSRTVLEPTQPPVKWAPGLRRG